MTCSRPVPCQEFPVKWRWSRPATLPVGRKKIVEHLIPPRARRGSVVITFDPPCCEVLRPRRFERQRADVQMPGTRGDFAVTVPRHIVLDDFGRSQQILLGLVDELDCRAYFKRLYDHLQLAVEPACCVRQLLPQPILITPHLAVGDEHVLPIGFAHHPQHGLADDDVIGSPALEGLLGDLWSNGSYRHRLTFKSMLIMRSSATLKGVPRQAWRISSIGMPA